MNKFYLISNKSIRGALWALTNFEGCDTVDLFTGKFKVEGEIIMSQIQGTKFVDVVSTGDTLNIYSNTMFEVFEKNSFTGWGKILVVVVLRNGQRIYQYSFLTVTGKCGSLDESKTQIEDVPISNSPSAKPLIVKRGLFFDEDTWDGSDIFNPEGTFFILVTEKVRDALIQHKFTNMAIERSDLVYRGTYLKYDTTPDFETWAARNNFKIR